MKCHTSFIIVDLSRLVTLPMKTNLIATLMAVVSVVLAPTSGHAQTELREWVGNWQIRVDPSQDGGCFAAVAFDGGDGLISMRIGFDLRSQNEVLYVALMHQGWSLVPNSDYRFQMKIDDTAVFEGLAQSSIGAGKLPTLRYNLHDPKKAAAFERVLAHGTNLYFRLNGTALPLVTLKDAAAVMKSLRGCQETVLAPGEQKPAETVAAQQSPVASSSSGASDVVGWLIGGGVGVLVISVLSRKRKPTATTRRASTGGGIVAVLLFGGGIIWLVNTWPTGQRHLDACITGLREAARGSMIFSDPLFRATNVFQSAEFLARNCSAGCLNPEDDYDYWTVHLLSDGKSTSVMCTLHHGFSF
jgi:hypothetical protein